MPFYERRVGLCLEFSMTSFWSKALWSQGSGDEVGLHQTGRLDCAETLEEEERLGGRQMGGKLHRTARSVKTFTAQFYLGAHLITVGPFSVTLLSA